jgi:fumarate hydratase subunit beta
MFKLSSQELRSHIKELHAGDRVLLSGTVYTGRDAAHKRIFELLDTGCELTIPLNEAIIYYAGPTPAQQGMPVGSCGPTTSSRMDKFAPRLLDLGLLGMIGKGERSQEVEDAIVRNGSIYFCAVGGAGALIAKCVEEAEEIAFTELGCESIKRLKVRDLPLIVAIDCHGGNLYKTGRAQYALDIRAERRLV